MDPASDANATNPYLQGSFAPIDRETDATLMDVIEGEVPRELRGSYVRNGPNPRFVPSGRHHWFDGDGMLHAAHFEGGTVRYQSRFVQTAGHLAEHDAGRALWTGIMESPKNNPKGIPYKDTANTDLAFHNGELVALWYVSGVPYRVDPCTLQTLGATDFGHGRPLRVSAHAKVDARSGEMMFFDFGPRAPFMSYGVVGRDGQLSHFTPVELPGPRLPHDMAVTDNFSILMDLPIFQDPTVKDKWRARFYPEMPARFGVIPRHGAGTAIRWFESDACYIYHTINAWEDGDEVVMVACRTADPVPPPDPANGKWAAMMANLKLFATLHEWRFNLETGETTERALDDQGSEFPMINLGVLGEKNRHSYHQVFADTPTLRFDGIRKYDLESGASRYVDYGDGRFGSESPFARRPGATEEDDGYLLSFVHDERDNRSELVILHAQDLSTVARLRAPTRIPLGFHACWAPADGGAA